MTLEEDLKLSADDAKKYEEFLCTGAQNELKASMMRRHFETIFKGQQKAPDGDLAFTSKEFRTQFIRTQGRLQGINAAEGTNFSLKPFSAVPLQSILPTDIFVHGSDINWRGINSSDDWLIFDVVFKHSNSAERFGVRVHGNLSRDRTFG